MAETGPQFQFDRDKFRELVLYIAGKCPPEKLGAVKYNKVLYYADMLHYVMTGHPITGATYRRRRLGPTTNSLLPALRELQSSNSISINDVPFFGFMKKEYSALRTADLQRFSAEEISLVDEVIKFVCEDHTAKGISELSHNLAWDSTKPDDVIPYVSAFLMYASEVSEEAINAAAQDAGEIEAERQNTSAVVSPLFKDLRASV